VNHVSVWNTRCIATRSIASILTKGPKGEQQLVARQARACRPFPYRGTVKVRRTRCMFHEFGLRPSGRWAPSISCNTEITYPTSPAFALNVLAPRLRPAAAIHSKALLGYGGFTRHAGLLGISHSICWVCHSGGTTNSKGGGRQSIAWSGHGLL
jgi:hypothetical protein